MSDSTITGRYWQPVEEPGNHQFITGENQRHGGFMSEATYSEALDSIVVTCADAAIMCNGLWLIGRRKVEPQPDWWVIGGRMRAGELIEVALQRNLKRELGLDLEDSRLKEIIGHYNLIWSKRAQSPIENGCHMFSILTAVEITNQEKDEISLNQEYATHAWVRPEKLLQVRNDYHPALVQMARDLLTHLSR